MIDCGKKEHDRIFWNYMRGDLAAYDRLKNTDALETGTFHVPADSDSKYDKAVMSESIVRLIGTVFSSYDSDGVIWAIDSDDMAQFVPEYGGVEILDVADNIRKVPIEKCKLAALLCLSTELASDAAFDLESYLLRRLAKSFAKAEDNAFISGTGEGEPVGLLHDTAGAQIGTTSADLNYDSVIDLYFSVKPEYRKGGVWLMNDETAHALKKLKDDTGNYLWRGSDDSIMGKPVMISEYMPNAESEAKPILFGDFSYYWLVKRSPVTIKVLKELFALNGQTGYLAFEFLDGKLIRRDAVKALQISA